MTAHDPSPRPRPREGSPVLESYTIDLLDPSELVPWSRNPRRNDLAAERLAKWIDASIWTVPILRDLDGVIVAGHTRLKAAKILGLPKVPVLTIPLRGEDARRMALADNRLGEIAEWEDQELEAQLREIEEMDDGAEALDLIGFDDFLSDAELDALEGSDTEPPPPPPTLSDRFVVPPMSILDQRQGYWRERSRKWMALGIASEVGRGENLIGRSETELAMMNGGLPSREERVAAAGGGVLYGAAHSGRDPSFYVQKRAVEERLGRELSTAEFIRDHYVVEEGSSGLSHSGTSVFDPVLCELVYRWFAPPGGAVLDPFAGGSVRGVVASLLGLSYTGVDLRSEQVEANRDQARAILGTRVRFDEKETDDPGEITPVVSLPARKAWIKRDDLFVHNGVRGSKARLGRALAEEAEGLVTASSRNATMVGRVARLAEAAGIPARIHIARAKEPTGQEKDAEAHGATIVRHKVAYLRTLLSKARKDAEARGWTMIEQGLEHDRYVEVNSGQVANIPDECSRVVVIVGSGMAASSILHGLDAIGRSDLPLLGVQVSDRDPSDLLDRRAPANWRERLTLVRASEDYEEEVNPWFEGHLLDPVYEAKAAPFIREGDLLYVVARRTHTSPPAVKEEAEPMKEWQKGIPLEPLREIAALFKDYDRGMVLGAFGATKERDVANAWAAGDLRLVRDGETVVGALLVKRLRAGSKVVDFTGEVRASTRAGDLQIRGFACRDGYDEDLAGALRDLVGGEVAWIETWNEHPRALGTVLAAFGERARSVAVKVKASSEQRRVFVVGDRAVSELSDSDNATLSRLDLDLDVEAFADEVEAASVGWAEHYSSYNKRKSWWAVSLRGYGGRVGFIEKPDEMSKAWKKKNAEKLEWKIEDTPLRAQLPGVEEILSAIPGKKHRVRLMRLDGAGGELSRHADITDRTAGTSDGSLMRIHVPLRTSPGVRFQSWTAEGSVLDRHFAPGEVFYLDTRKPHRAINEGDASRIHLVVDVEASEALRSLLVEEPPPVSVVDPVPFPPSPPCAPLDPELVPSGGREESAKTLPVWIEGDSRTAIAEMPSEQSFDLVFTCPPYFDLEVYSDDPKDLSKAEDYEGFLDGLRDCLGAAAARLNEVGFVVVVISDVRDRRGFYRGLVSDTIRILDDIGAPLYNEAIFVNHYGSLPIRIGRIFSATRKLGRTHQVVLVGLKGSPQKVRETLGDVAVALPEELLGLED